VRPLRLEEIVDRESYAAIRDEYRRRVIEHKRVRRLAVGERVTLLFEDRETLRFQVQEMLQVERIDAPEQVQHELDVYNELMPGERELSATLFVEIEELSRIRSELDRLVGIDEHVALRVGADAAASRIAARFDPKQREEDRISAVQYIRFSLDPDAARRLADPAVPAAIEIDHPNYRRDVALEGALRESLVAGLTSDPAPLLASPRGPAREDSLLFEVGRLRVVARAGRETDLLVTAPEVSASAWLRGDADFGADLEQALRRALRHVQERAGSAQVEVIAPGDDAPLGWRVSPGSRR
jgi:hypothetical protein